MKRIVIFFVTHLFFSSCLVYSQDANKIDSMFKNHLKSLEDSIDKYSISDSIKVYIYGSDKIFLDVLSEISDFKFEQNGYTLQPKISKNELYNIRKWYKEHRKKLNWFKIYNLFKIHEDYNNAYKIIRNDDTSSYELYKRRLDSLELEHKRLLNLNTFNPSK